MKSTIVKNSAFILKGKKLINFVKLVFKAFFLMIVLVETREQVHTSKTTKLIGDMRTQYSFYFVKK